MNLQPYLFFPGNCTEAMNFYKEVFGGELTTMPNPSGKGVMHADLKGGIINLMASDSDRTTPYETCRITLSLNGTDGDKITETFNKLAEGGAITSPIKVESWGDAFGTVTDKFDIDWMVNFAAA
ncbi:VOC family protein [soil metagenome]